MKERIVGIDLARALAIFGMVIVNFKIAMGAETGSQLLLSFAGLFEGRASALFVILAGIGVTHLTNHARVSHDPTIEFQGRMALVKRGLLLVLIGFMYTPIWEADILHFYGFYFLIAAFVFTMNDRALILIALCLIVIFPLLTVFFDYEKNWNWTTLTYENLWSLDGMARHVLFNGFHPVFPWAAFLVFGMWLGRQDLSSGLIRNALLMKAFLIFVVVEAIFFGLRSALGDGGVLGLTAEEATLLFSVSIIPPFPQYVLSSAASAVMVIMICLLLADMFSRNRVIRWLCQTGQLSLTLYVAHVIIGMGTLESLGWLHDQPIHVSLLCALIFCVVSVIFSVTWRRFYQYGPLEWVFRQAIQRLG